MEQVIIQLYFNLGCPKLKQHFKKHQENRLVQFEYLQDLSECEFISDFLREYPIPHDDDRKFIIELIKQFPCCFKKLERYCDDVELIRICLEQGEQLDNIPSELENDIEWIRKILKKNVNNYESLSDHVKSQFTLQEIIQLPYVKRFFIVDNFEKEDLNCLDRNVLIEAIEKDIIPSSFFSGSLFDREITLLFIKQRRCYSTLLKIDSIDWKGDQEAFDAIVFSNNVLIESGRRKKHISVLECIPQFKDDRDFVLKIIDHDPQSFQFCSDRLKSDKVIALKAIAKDGFQLEYANESLKSDKEIIITAINEHPQFFGKASKKLKSDRELILYALKRPQASYAAQYIDSSFFKDTEIRDLVIRSGHVYGFDNLDCTREQVMACVSSNPLTISKFPNYFNDEGVLLCCVKQSGYALSEIPVQNRTFNVCLEAVRNYSGALRECEGLPFLDELVMEYVKTTTPYLYIFPKCYSFSMEIFKQVIPYDVKGELFKLAPEEAKKDRELVLKYVKLNGKVFNELSAELQADPIIRKEAIKHGLHKKPFIPLK